MSFKRITTTTVGTLALAASVSFLSSCKPKLTLELSPSTVEIDEGETEELTATLTRDGTPQGGVTVQFESADVGVAGVSPASATTNAAGQTEVAVTGASAGNTDVTATADGASASAAVTVTRPPVGMQTIEIVGVAGDRANWHVRIDGVAQDPPRNPHEITVRPGDEITWSVEGSFHGVVFFGRANAEAILEFDAAVGLPRSDNPNGFGAGWFGTGGGGAGTILARATVKAGVASTELDFTCVIHGSPATDTNNMRGKLVIQ